MVKVQKNRWAGCDYQQLNETIIKLTDDWKNSSFHGLNGMDMCWKIRELTEVKIGSVITSEDVLAWAKWVEAHMAQSVVMNSLTEAKELDKIKIAKNMCKEIQEVAHRWEQP